MLLRALVSRGRWSALCEQARRGIVVTRLITASGGRPRLPATYADVGSSAAEPSTRDQLRFRLRGSHPSTCAAESHMLEYTILVSVSGGVGGAALANERVAAPQSRRDRYC